MKPHVTLLCYSLTPVFGRMPVNVLYSHHNVLNVQGVKQERWAQSPHLNGPQHLQCTNSSYLPDVCCLLGVVVLSLTTYITVGVVGVWLGGPAVLLANRLCVSVLYVWTHICLCVLLSINVC